MTITNSELINEFRESGGIQYEDRIPDPTQASLQESMQAMLLFPNMWNEFHHFLINRIGLTVFRNKSWTNPLKFLKSGKMHYGAAIEEIHGNLIKAREYNADRSSLEKDVWGQERLDVRTAFHRINREDKYKITINDAMLRRAFVNEGELARMMSIEMTAMQNSDEWDEFLIMCNLFNEFEKSGGFHKINVPDVRALDSDGSAARLALRIMRAEADEMEFFNTKYNSMGMPNFCKSEDLVLFMTPKFKAAIDVEALAAAFNMDKMVAEGRVVLIPDDALNIKGAQCIITTKYFFIAHDTLIENRSIQNPDGLYTNFWLHHHGIYSVSLFENSILLTSEPVAADPATEYKVASVNVPTYSRDGVTNSDLVAGQVYLVSTTVETLPDSNDTKLQAVTWEITTDVESQHTRIDQSGILHIGEDETAAGLTVRATSTWVDPAAPETPRKFADAPCEISGGTPPPFPG